MKIYASAGAMPQGRAFTIRAQANEAEILLYDVIGQDFWTGDGVTAKKFAQQLATLGPVSRILLRINSPGGDVFDGTAIYNLLKTHGAKIDVVVDGIAASAASVVAMAGDKITMAENAMMMVHNPWTIAVGNSTDMRKVADMLDKVGEAMRASYARTGLKDSELAALLDAETWLTAKDAVAQGFADEIGEPAAVHASFDLSQFKNTPESLKTRAIAAEKTVSDEQLWGAAAVISNKRLDLAERQ
jgi:ATP-dependent Clp protease protease subunit